MSSLIDFLYDLENDPKISKLILSELANNKINELRQIIYKVSHLYGDDDAQFLEEYIEDVIATWSDNIDIVITCFREFLQKAII